MPPMLHFVPFCLKVEFTTVSLVSIASLIFILLSLQVPLVLISFCFHCSFLLLFLSFPHHGWLKSPTSHVYWHYVIMIVE